MPKLVIYRDGTEVQLYDLTAAQVHIGRKKGNDLVLDDSTVSGHHAVITVEPEPTVEDVGSTNGTFVNGARITKVALKDGDRVRMGHHELVYFGRRDFDATVIIPPPSAVRSAAVKVLNGSRAGEVIALTKAHTTLGEPGSQVVVIARRGEGYVLLPVGGVGGKGAPQINGKAVGGESVPLQSGDVIEVAGMRAQFTTT